jgi:outer membrane receptor for ferrienterochelin and colicins
MILALGLSAQEADTTTWSIDIEDVVVTATYAPTDARNAIHQVRVLEQEDIERLQARNLEQLLVTDVNVRIEQDPQLGTRVNLSGLDGQNVKIMIDGVPVVGRLNGNIDLAQIPMYDVERVEIVEGPLAVNYGTDALAGVINIITKKSQLNRFNVQLDASYEDKGERTTMLGFGLRPTDKLLIRAQAGMEDFRGFDFDTTRSMPWNPKEQRFAKVSARYALAPGHDLRYSFNAFDEKVTNEGDIRRPIFRPYAFDEEYRTLRQDHSLHYDGTMNERWYLTSFVAYNSWDREKDYWRRDMESGEILFVPTQGDTSKVTSWNWRSTIALQDDDIPVAFMAGLDLRYEDFSGERVANPDADNEGFSFISDNAVFSSVKYRALNDKLTMEGGLRYAYNNRFNSPVIPSFNLKYDLNKHWTFRGSYGKGFRAPDIKELFFSFIDVNHFILGNADLTPETSHNFQGGFTYYRYHEDQEVTFGMNGFYNRVLDRIELFEYVETPEGRVPALDTLTNEYTYFNLNEFQSTGLSVRMGYDRPNWRVRASYGLIGSRSVDRKGADDRFQPFLWSNEISLDGRYTIPVLNVDAQLLVRFFDRRFTFFQDVNEDGNAVVGYRKQEGFTSMDVSLGRNFLDGDLRVTAGIRNLLGITDATVIGNSQTTGSHSSSSSSQIVSTGRRWFVGLTYNINWGQ